MTVSSSQLNTIRAETNDEASNTFEIECNYEEVMNETLGKFDLHLCAYIASQIENKIIENMRKASKKECSQCIEVFHENEIFHDELITMKRLTNAAHKEPCLSTVNIVIFTNKILNMVENQVILTNNIYDKILRTVMNWLPIEEFYTQSEFNNHEQMNETSSQLSHKEKFICMIVNEYMKLKSKKIGGRISEEERGTYIRHNNKKRVHEKGQ